MGRVQAVVEGRPCVDSRSLRRPGAPLLCVTAPPLPAPATAAPAALWPGGPAPAGRPALPPRPPCGRPRGDRRPAGDPGRRLPPRPQARARVGPSRCPRSSASSLKQRPQVILAESHKLPLVGLELVIKTGNAASPRGAGRSGRPDRRHAGRGHQDPGRPRHRRRHLLLGAALRPPPAGTPPPSVSGLSDNIDKALVIWADVLLAPAFDQQEFNRVRDILLTAFKRRKDSPPVTRQPHLPSRVLLRREPPLRLAGPAAPTKTIKSITPADLRTFWQTYYRAQQRRPGHRRRHERGRRARPD